jgi:hypothetical protein
MSLKFRNFKFSFFLVILLQSTVAISADKQSVFVYSPDGNGGLLINTNLNTFLSFSSDHIETIYQCTDKQSFICLKAPNFVFAIPRNFTNEKKWDFEGYYYEQSDEQEREVLGVKIKGISIFQSKSEKWRKEIDIDSFYPIEYFFSKERGLVSISWMFSSPYGVKSFILKSKCGFEASKSCNS